MLRLAKRQSLPAAPLEPSVRTRRRWPPAAKKAGEPRQCAMTLQDKIHLSVTRRQATIVAIAHTDTQYTLPRLCCWQQDKETDAAPCTIIECTYIHECRKHGYLQGDWERRYEAERQASPHAAPHSQPHEVAQSCNDLGCCSLLRLAVTVLRCRSLGDVLQGLQLWRQAKGQPAAHAAQGPETLQGKGTGQNCGTDQFALQSSIASSGILHMLCKIDMSAGLHVSACRCKRCMNSANTSNTVWMVTGYASGAAIKSKQRQDCSCIDKLSSTGPEWI